jgi:L-threonylcarbamoyladenylate synthase
LSDVPIVGTSANFSGEKTPFTLEGLDKALIKLVDFVLEGKTKGGGLASTVVDCTITPWKIIRQGSVFLPDL